MRFFHFAVRLYHTQTTIFFAAHIFCPYPAQPHGRRPSIHMSCVMRALRALHKESSRLCGPLLMKKAAQSILQTIRAAFI